MHVFSGDSAADCYRAGGGQGDTIVWREAMAHGRLPTVDDTQWADLRGRELSAGSEASADEVTSQLRLQLDQVQDARSDLVAWFGRDLFCLLNLLFVAAQLERADDVGLRLVMPDDTATPARQCLGSFSPEQLVALAGDARVVEGAEPTSAPTMAGPTCCSNTNCARWDTKSHWSAGWGRHAADSCRSRSAAERCWRAANGSNRRSPWRTRRRTWLGAGTRTAYVL